MNERDRPNSSRRSRPGFERRVAFFTLLTGLPGALVALILLWTGDFTPKVQWTLTLFVVLGGLAFGSALMQRVVFPLRTVSNMLAALREGDFSLRAHQTGSDDALSQVMFEVNALGDTLRQQRLGALEATALLRKVMAEIDVAVYAFDSEQKLRLVNRRGERLLKQGRERLRGRLAADLGLEECLSGPAPRVADLSLPGGSGRWEIRRSTFREGGLPHQLLVLSDLTQTLRDEERQAWRRLIQVLRHEINNSLAPIDSLAGSLAALIGRDPRPEDWESDMCGGLSVIRDRSRALNRFMTAYSRLTRLPKPTRAAVNVANWVRRVVDLETRQRVVVEAGPELTIEADGDQLDQLLINLVRNAVDAVQETGGEVHIGWGADADAADFLEVWVRDDGPGLTSTENLFVPFFTTKPNGEGIGLALSRQIAEAHRGRLTLENQRGAAGCVARLILPLH